MRTYTLTPEEQAIAEARGFLRLPDGAQIDVQPGGAGLCLVIMATDGDVMAALPLPFDLAAALSCKLRAALMALAHEQRLKDQPDEPDEARRSQFDVAPDADDDGEWELVF